MNHEKKIAPRRQQLFFTEVGHGKYILSHAVADDFEDDGILQALILEKKQLGRHTCEALRYALEFESATYQKDEKIKVQNLF